MYKIEIEFKKGTPVVDVELIRRVIGMFANVAFVGIIEIRPTSRALDAASVPPLVEFLSNPEDYQDAEQLSQPRQ